jgi:tetratricopeptide (TPR) repeat protein
MSKKLPPEVQAIISASDAGYHATTVELVDAFLENNPDSLRAWLDLGHSLAQLARYDAAETAYEKAISLAADGDQSGIYGEMGNLFRAKGDYNSAAAWYQKQIDADPGDAAGFLFLGNLELKRGNCTAAIKALELAAECDKYYVEEVHYALGCAYRSQGNFVEAKKHLQIAVNEEPKFAAAQVALKDVNSAA